MKNICLLVLILGLIKSQAQITFNNTYSIENNSAINSEIGWEVLVDEEGYTIVTGQFCSNNGPYCTGIIKTDFEGEVIWQNVFPYPLELRAGGKFIKTPDGGYAIAGDQLIGNEEYRFFLLRLDSTGDSLWIKFYGDTIKEFPRNVVLAPDNGFIIHGDGGSGFADKAIVRTDSTGTMLWEKNLGLTSGNVYRNEFGNLVLLPDKSMALAYRASFTTLGFPDSAALTKLSSTGEVLWTKYYYQMSVLCSPTLRLLPNGNFLMSGCKEENGFDYYATFLLLDPDGNIIKEKNRLALVTGGIADVSLTSNGDILACGRNDSILLAENLPYGSAAWIMRLDSDLNILWDRNYVSLKHGDGATLYSIKEAPDGGIITTGGTILDTLENGGFDPNLWLVKLGGDGCWQPGCGDEGFIFLAVDEKEGLDIGRQVYFTMNPNPVSKNLNIRLMNAAFSQQPILKLYNAAGALLRSETIERGILDVTWDMSAYSPGFYFLTYEKNGLVVQSEKLVVFRE